jgi:pimeloyl-ACP methyl ester carboxylesterase
VSGTVGEVLSVESADGTRVGCELLGEGPPLLVVHGSIADRRRWGAVRDGLAARFRVHLMDRRGRGLSAEEGPGGYALAREAEDIRALVSAIGDGVLVLAHSYGGTCSLEAAVEAPQIARMLVYEPAFAPEGDPVFPHAALAEVITALERGDRETAVLMFYKHALALDDQAIAQVRASPLWQLRLEAADTLGREATAANAYELRSDRLARIAAPVRFLLGTDTAPALQRSTRAAHEALPGSELVELPGEAHNAMDTHPEAFVAQVDDWLRR